jgi:hypothetical protein
MCAKNLKCLPCVLGLSICAGKVMGQHMNAKDAPCQGIGAAAAETQCLVTESQAPRRS